MKVSFFNVAMIAAISAFLPNAYAINLQSYEDLTISPDATELKDITIAKGTGPAPVAAKPKKDDGPVVDHMKGVNYTHSAMQSAITALMEESKQLDAALLAKSAEEAKPKSLITVLENGINIDLKNFLVDANLPYAEVKEDGIPMPEIVKAVLASPDTVIKTVKPAAKADVKAEAKPVDKKDAKDAKKDEKAADKKK